MLTASFLDQNYLGRHISSICPNGFDSDNKNHCAHFVSHVLNLSFGVTCRNLVAGANRNGAGGNVRVQEIFAQCPVVQEIVECTPDMKGLIFVSAPSNFQTTDNGTTIRNVPNKHIGILLGGIVWHYSNGQRQVVKMPMSEFLFHYPNQQNTLWFGTMPASAVAGVCVAP